MKIMVDGSHDCCCRAQFSEEAICQNGGRSSGSATSKMEQTKPTLAAGRPKSRLTAALAAEMAPKKHEVIANSSKRSQLWQSRHDPSVV
jgi:hypothetical protein